MLTIFFVLVGLTSFTQSTFGDFVVDVEVLNGTGKEEIKIRLAVKNMTGKPVSIFKIRRVDYRRERIRALGNYVVEIQKFEDSQYALFAPSSDMDPILDNQAHVSLRPGETITDTLYVEGISFSRSPSDKGGFPKGKYRLRVYFNASLRHCNDANVSKWQEFEIE